MERTFIPHFADAAVLGMLFGPIFIEDSAFSFCVPPNERRSILRLLFYERDRCSIRKMLFCHYNEQHFSIFPFFPIVKYNWIVCFPKGNTYCKLNFKEREKFIYLEKYTKNFICILSKTVKQ